MHEKILRLMPTERQKRIELFDFEINNDNLFVNIYRKTYSEDISGYFLRGKNGTAVIVNDSLSTAQQSNVIKNILKGMKGCPSSEFGFIDKEMNFACGGHCCFSV